MNSRITALALAALLCFPTASVSATVATDTVLEWNAIMVATTRTLNPFAQARIAAVTQVAVFEAVNAIAGGFEPYRQALNAPAGASVEAAAVTAAHDVLVHYVAAATATLDAAEGASLGAIPNGQSKVDGIAVGSAAAAALITARAADGASPAQFFQQTDTTPGAWQPTPSCPSAGGILFQWQNVTPFGIRSNDQFRPGPPPALTSPEYARDYDEVRRVGGVDSLERPADRADVARLFAGLSAAGAWNAVARQLAVAHGTSLTDNARILALLNMAISDGLTSSMQAKYHYLAWRPETAIRAGDADGNPATVGVGGFVPFVTTPCFPGYPSAHASASYAARAILERVWGSAGHSLVITDSALPGKVFSYTSLRQITDDIDDARVYGGIHFRFDQEAGARMGRRIGQFVFAHNLLATDE